MKKSFFDRFGVGTLVIVIGCWFVGKQLGIIDFGLGKLILIALGVLIIFYGIKMISNNKKGDGNHESTWSKYNPNMQAPPPPPPLHEDPTVAGNKYEQDFYNASKEGHHSPPPEFKDFGKGGSWKNFGHDHSYDHTYHETGSDKINRSTFIGDFHFGKDYWELKPMNLSAFIGDTTIDLSKAQIPFGETRIYISAFIGDIKVFVPNDATVGIKVQMNAFIGDCKFLNAHESGMMRQVNQESMYYHESDRKVVIIVSTFIGDVKVKRVG